MAKTLELRRHTEAEGDVLTAEGVRTAVQIGTRLQASYDVVISSGAQRATQTAACLLARLSEEHGVVTLTDPSHDIRVGNRVTVVPIHVCVTVNMLRELFLVDDDQVVDTLNVDGGLLAH